MRTLTFLALASSLALTAACGDDSSSTPTDGKTVDAPKVFEDAPVTVPAMITLSGQVLELSTNPPAPTGGSVVTAYKVSDDSVLGTATSDTTAGPTKGTFSITVQTGGVPVNGYLKAVTPGAGANEFKVTYLYPPASFVADYAGAPVFVLKKATYDIVNSSLLQNNQISDLTKGWLALLVEDAAGAPVAGAVVTSNPMGQVNYNGAGTSIPSGTATSTSTDGIAYDTFLAAGQVAVHATKTGSTFISHEIKVRPDVVTLTIIKE